MPVARLRHRKQRGTLWKKSNAWLLRYSAPDEKGRPVRKTIRLADAEGDYRTKTAARELADRFLKPLNEATGNQQLAISLKDFVEETYLPAIAQQKRASTAHGYGNLWKRYFGPYNKIIISAFRTADGERILNAINEEHDLCGTTLGHIKAFLSGIFRHAKRLGVLTNENPIRDIVVPRARPAKETYAYSLNEIAAMLEILPEPAATIVACAAYTGVRKGELRGFRWENYDGRDIKITEAWWEDTVDEPKTAKSKAPVPIIPQLAARLDKHRKNFGGVSNFDGGVKNSAAMSGLMFPAISEVICLPSSSKQITCETTPGLLTPIDLDALARDVIIPALKLAGIEWHGWHAFRRGLATNLHALGVQSKIIQRVLRHSNVATTEKHYIKGTDEEVSAAMKKLAEVSG